MSREIKFRAWDKGVSKFLTYCSSAEMLLFSDYGRSQNVILMQFTGLKDKNGKEIYEGDIYLSEYIGGKKTPPQAVEWEDSGYRIKDGLFAEIIGNIYEDSELLEAKA